MADLSYDDVRKILAIVDASTLDEIHIEIGDFKLDVRRRGAAQTAPASAPTAGRAQPPAAPNPIAPARQEIGLEPGQFVVSAPMLGTFYRAPAPDAAPFVEVGGEVSAGDSLCIIEVMKLMNTIKAEQAGRVVAIPAQNATLVEFGEALIVFEPL